MLKKLQYFIWLVVLLMFLPKDVTAANTKSEMAINYKLSKWLYNEEQNKLFALSDTGKSLYIINTDTLTLEKTIQFSSGGNSITQDGDVLYITFSTGKEIKKYDIVTGNELGTIAVEERPYGMLKSGNKVYYNSTSTVHEYDLEKGTEKRLNVFLSSPKYVIDEKEQMMYIGAYSSRNIDLISYDLINDTVKLRASAPISLEFNSPRGNMIVSDDILYYADREYDKERFGRPEGDYGNDAIIDIKEDVVFGLQGVYNKKTHVKISSYKTEASLVAAGEKTVLLYSKKDAKISKYSSSEIITTKNISEVIQEERITPVPQTKKAKKELNNLRKLDMQSTLTEWILDESNDMMYAISEKDKALFFLDGTTLDIKNSIVFKSNPSDIALYKGQLYVSLYDARQIKVVDLGTQNVVKTLYTAAMPYRMEIDLDKIYFVQPDSYSDLYEYDLVSDTEQVAYSKFGDFTKADLAVNTKDHILYIGESGTTRCQVFYFDIVTNTMIAESDYYNAYYIPDRKILFDGSNVYYAQRALDSKDPLRVIGAYGNGTDDKKIVCVKNDLVFMPEAIYDRNTFQLVETLDGKSPLFELSKDGAMYQYDTKKKQVIKSKKDSIVTVSFNTMGGTTMEDIQVDKHEKLMIPYSPSKESYTFAGWYLDKGYSVLWDNDYDLVEDHMTLYARWIKNIECPKELKAVPIAFNKIKLSWDSVKGAKEYLLFRKDSINGMISCIKTTTDTNYVDSSVKTGKTYYYTMIAYGNQDGITVGGEYTNTVSAKTALGTASNVRGNGTSTSQIKVQWGAVSGADGYDVYLSKKSNTEFKHLASVKGTSYTVNKLSYDTKYYFKVKAYRIVDNKKVYGAFSSVGNTSTTIGQVTGIKTTGIKYNGYTLSFQSVKGAAYYEVYRATSKNGAYKLVKTTTSCSYKEEGAATGVTYYYKVRACKKDKKSYGAYSGITNAKAKLAKPVELKVKKASANSTKITWKKVSGASGYEVYRAASKTGTYKKVATVKTASYTNKKLAKKKPYYYKVRAYRIVNKKKVYSEYSTIKYIKL